MERRVARLQILNTEFFSLKIRSPALRTVVFDVAKLESMLRDALGEVSGLEMMLVTPRARVRRNETPFSLKLSVPTNFCLNTHSLRLLC